MENRSGSNNKDNNRTNDKLNPLKDHGIWTLSLINIIHDLKKWVSTFHNGLIRVEKLMSSSLERIFAK
jgi:hypothetical protein